MSRIKFYARGASMSGQNISGPKCRIFDSNFSLGTVKQSVFEKADFYNCDISHTNFENVSFKECYLYRLVTDITKFDECDFTDCCMMDFTFDNCIFYRCNFTNCDMRHVTFESCMFHECDFKDADLPPFFKPLEMSNCKNVPYIPMACPEEGEFIGYKIASSEQWPAMSSLIMPHENIGPADVLVTLKIPADARRSSAGGRKCRCDKAEVIELEHINSNLSIPFAFSKYDARFVYHVGEEISVPYFDENRWNECSTGIHFFINRKEALQYYNVMEAYYGRR